MKFSAYKEAMGADGNYRDLPKDKKARYLVRSAKEARRAGTLDADGYDRAIKWAYRVDHSAAWLEEIGGK